MNAIQEAAKTYREAGIAVTRIRQGEKRPTDAGWTTRSAEPEEFQDGDNIGLLCGWLSGDLVCVDLDSRDAIDAADEFLPPTQAIEGRPGKPRSHRWFRVTDVPEWGTSKAGASTQAAVAAGKHPGPWKRQFRSAAGVAIDFIGSGGQAACPPSTHDSGEVREWEPGHGIEQAAVLPFETLWEAVCLLAEAVGAKVPDLKPREKRQPREATPPSQPSTPRQPKAARTPVAAVRCDVPMDERVRRCRRWLPQAPLAVSKHGGHDTTYLVARRIGNDFLVTDKEHAMDLMRDYNDMLAEYGQETWSEGELEHKVDSALAAAADPKYPPGCALKPPRKWDDAARLADEFLALHTVHFVKDTAYFYRDGAYSVATDVWLEGIVRAFVETRAEAEFESEGEKRAKLIRVFGDALNSGTVPTGFRSLEQVRAKRERLEGTVATVPPVTAAMVANAVKAIRSRCQLLDDTQLDTWLPPSSGPSVLAVRNGLLDPVMRTLHPASADWFSMVRLPVAFDPQAPRPTKWLTFLDDIMERDSERIAIIQEIFGACLDRDLQLKFFAAFVGEGNRGKSVVMHVLNCVLGPANCSAVGLQELSTNRFASFGLFGKLANLIGDQGFMESADEGKLKTLTGADATTFEQKGRDTFTAVNKTKILYASNTPPTFTDKSNATWNRMVAIPFNYAAREAMKNPALLGDFYWADELPGILNWALAGLERLRSQRRFTHSALCEALKRQNRLDSNPARQFLLETYEHTGNEADFVPVADLYAAYKDWAAKNGFTKLLTSPKLVREVDSAFTGIEEGVTKRIGSTTARVRLGLRKRDTGYTVAGSILPAADATATPVPRSLI